MASFLHARKAGGRWLVRIEDIDPPREAPGATDSILRALEAYALHWDGRVVFQSQRLARYRDVADRLLREGLAFHCQCSRQQLQAHGGIHTGVCVAKHAAHDGNASVRVAVFDHGGSSPITFQDTLQGRISVDLARSSGDYVILRRDGLVAYHLAVVVDDADQGITDIVRGIDLLDTTAVHIHLRSVLGLPSPRYAHLPVLVNSDGQKLSKQSGAAPVSVTGDTLSLTSISILRMLGIEVPVDAIGASPAELWKWAGERWNPLQLANQRALKPPEEAASETS